MAVKKIKKPITPRKPSEPIPPEEFWERNKYIFDRYDLETEKSFSDIIKKVPKGISLEDIKIRCDENVDYYGCNCCSSTSYDTKIYYMEKFPNPRFDADKKNYQKKLKTYQKKLEKYIEDKKEHDLKKVLYDSQEKDRELENLKKEADRIEKEKKNLDKKLAKIKKEIAA